MLKLNKFKLTIRPAARIRPTNITRFMLKALEVLLCQTAEFIVGTLGVVGSGKTVAPFAELL